MRRGLLILLALLVVTWFEFQVYPGQTYLQGETQLLVPMLERLDTPGFLSRDLVASNPAFAYTIYDEITQFLHATAHLTFEQAVLGQQPVFRFLAVLGIFLAARALNVSTAVSVASSALINAITCLTAPAAFLTNLEATPSAFALSLVICAVGLLMNRHALLAALAVGVALLYDPMIAAAFWLLLIVTWIFNPALRRLLRPAWPVLLVFLLTLGNLVQLQSGLGAGQELTATLDAATILLVKLRTPWVWLPLWIPREIWSYLFLAVAAVWALARISKRTDRLTRWILMGMVCIGLASAAVAFILIYRHSQLATAMPPARNLVFTVLASLLLYCAAAWYAYERRKWMETSLWTVLVFAAILNPQVLDLLHLQTTFAHASERSSDLDSLAQWAAEGTWGSSMFQFPDAGLSEDPGVFRALSKRALWADWGSGVIADHSPLAGAEWQSRWNASMAQGYSLEKLQAMLPLPIDYYVLLRKNAVPGVQPAYANASYVAYDAADLRRAVLLPPKPKPR